MLLDRGASRDAARVRELIAVGLGEARHGTRDHPAPAPARADGERADGL